MMKKVLCAVFISIFFSSVWATESLVSVKSPYTVKETANRFGNILKDKGFTIFLRINHQQNAKKVDLAIKSAEVIIFGNPKIGTKLMQCSPAVAIDLPQKALFWQDENDQVWLSYNNPEYLKERHNIKGCDQIIDKISGALAKLSKAAVAK